MKLYKTLLWCLAVVIVYSIFVVVKIDGIQRRISNFKQEYKEGKGYAYRNNKMGIDLSKYEDFMGNDSAWYNRYHVITHSGGALDGKPYMQAWEAWNYYYENGNRVFDADLSFTKDSVLVLRHEWYDNLEQKNISENAIPSYEEFMSTPIHYKYTPMSCRDMINFMKDKGDAYVACDYKDDGIATFECLVDEARNMGCGDVLDRIIISIYSFEDYDRIKEIYDFKQWDVRQYENEPHNYEELAAFCMQKRIPVCRIKQRYIDAGDNISTLTEHGIKVFVAVVNNLSKLEKCKNMLQGGGRMCFGLYFGKGFRFNR